MVRLNALDARRPGERVERVRLDLEGEEGDRLELPPGAIAGPRELPEEGTLHGGDRTPLAPDGRGRRQHALRSRRFGELDDHLHPPFVPHGLEHVFRNDR